MKKNLPKKPTKPQLTNKKKIIIKTPHSKARSKTKPRNLVLAVLKAFLVPVWDGPKDFPAELAYFWNYWQILLMGISSFGPKLMT